MFKIVIYLISVGLSVRGEELQIKNNGQVDLLVSVTGIENFVVSAGQTVPVTVPDNFTGSITGAPTDLGDMELPKTRIEMTLSPMGDAYDVSLLSGFNIKAKINPIQGRRCKPASCLADINSVCSSRNQIQDSKGAVVGCYNSPFLFKAACPRAVVTSADVRNVFTCTADSYFITLG